MLTKDGFVDPPIQGQEQVLNILIHGSALEVCLAELRYSETLVYDYAVRDECAQIRDGVPFRE